VVSVRADAQPVAARRPSGLSSHRRQRPAAGRGRRPGLLVTPWEARRPWPPPGPVAARAASETPGQRIRRTREPDSGMGKEKTMSSPSDAEVIGRSLGERGARPRGPPLALPAVAARGAT